MDTIKHPIEPRNEKAVLPRRSAEGEQTRITCSPQVVFGVDKLKVSCWINWRDRRVFERLEMHKKCMQDTENQQQVPFDFAKSQYRDNFILYRTGVTKFSYRLKTGDTFLFLSPRPHTSVLHNLQIEIGSLSSQEDARGVFEEIIKMINTLGGFVDKMTVQEIHLAADLIGVPLDCTQFFFYKNWITRARKKNLYIDTDNVTGVAVGKGNIMFRAYDKIAEMKEKRESAKQEYFAKKWNVDLENIEVTRCEFQLRRPVLKQFDCDTDTVDQVFENIHSIWKYLTHKWCRFSVSPVDRKNKNQQKSKISYYWKILQDISFSNLQKTATRIKQPLIKNVDALLDQFRGIAMSIAASRGLLGDNLSTIVNTARNVIEQELERFFVQDESEFRRRMQVRFDECFNTVL